MVPLRCPVDQLPTDRRFYIYGAGASGRLCRAVFAAVHRRSAAGFIDSTQDGTVDGLAIQPVASFIAEWRSGALGDPVIVICSEALDPIYRELERQGFTGPVLNGQVFFMQELAHLTAPETTHMILDAKYGHGVRHGYSHPDHKALRRCLESGHERYRATLRQIRACAERFQSIPATTEEACVPHWINGFLSGLDSMSIYAMVAMKRPRLYIEIGSGNSTMFARQAIKDFGLETRIRSVDPWPRAEINTICDEIFRVPFEEVAETCLADIDERDLLFIDSSHRAFQGSDVTVFMTESLPDLPNNLTVGIHDIFFPEDYLPEWQGRYYNEQYLLACWLLAAPERFEILLPAWYIGRQPEFQDDLSRLFQDGGVPPEVREGCAFWFTVRR